MCPVCISTMALTVAGATSTGGLGAFVAKIFLFKNRTKKAQRNQSPAVRGSAGHVISNQ